MTRYAALLSVMLLFSIGQILDPEDVVPSLAQDPHLESGFPVQVFFKGASAYFGPGLNTVAANIDSDPELEIVVTYGKQGPIVAFKADASVVPGWPPEVVNGYAYPAAGYLTGSVVWMSVVSEFFDFRSAAFDARARFLPGWPIYHFEKSDIPPTLADLDGDGIDEILTSQNENTIYAYRADGSLLPGWPVMQPSPTQYFNNIAVADLDQDGDYEIVAGSGNGVIYGHVLFAYHHDGNPVDGFPISFLAPVNVCPVIGDVDGDGEVEILVNGYSSTSVSYKIYMYTGSGILKRVVPLSGSTPFWNLPALADLDEDGVPEIILQTLTTIDVFYGDGTLFPGWPVQLESSAFTILAPVVGDVDGDQKPDIVILRGKANAVAELLVYDRFGTLLPGFPKVILGISDTVPAIADIDLDGRNEIILNSTFMGSYEGFYDSIWVFDLGGAAHGKIEWGLLGGSPQHHMVYPPLPLRAPVFSYHNYLPLLVSPIGAANDGIRGRILANGEGQSGIPLELRRLDGTTWTTIRTTITGSQGDYQFTGITPLAENQAYAVRYQNTSLLPEFLKEWNSRQIYTYWSNKIVGMSEFDIAAIDLIFPDDQMEVTIPTTFTWHTRIAYIAELFSLYIYEPGSSVKIFESNPFLYADGLVLNALPVGFYYNIPYRWTIHVLGPDGSKSSIIESREIIFVQSTTQMNVENEIVTPIYK